MKDIKAKVELKIYLDGKGFGPGPMRLLMGIEQEGSLQASAQKMGMAYSKAWKTIRMIESEWGIQFLIRKTGGKNGGGSTLTEEGRDLLYRYQKMLTEIECATDSAFEKYFNN